MSSVPGLTPGEDHRRAAPQRTRVLLPAPEDRARRCSGTLLREHRFSGAERFRGREPEGFSFAPVQGMLKGFIDLVFEFQGRFYVVDWKSNLLGSRIEDYSAAALAERDSPPALLLSIPALHRRAGSLPAPAAAGTTATSSTSAESITCSCAASIPPGPIRHSPGPAAGTVGRAQLGAPADLARRGEGGARAHE